VERRSQNAERLTVTDLRTGQPHDLKTRIKAYALRIVRLYVALPKSTEAQALGRQMLRSGTSVGAHYREAIRARSIAEFVSKMEGGLQELEETAYWLALLAESGIMTLGHLRDLCRETDDLIAIFVSSVNTAKQRRDAER
jgi:four helix bundle protein